MQILRKIPGLVYLPRLLKRLLRRLPGLVFLYHSCRLVYLLRRTNNFRYVYPASPPGSYYSPLPDYKEILTRSQELFGQDSVEVPGVNLREEAQLDLLDDFSSYHNDLTFPRLPTEGRRYYLENHMFSYADAISLYGVMRKYRPRRVVEVGSGFSSAAMLDVSDLFLRAEVNFTFIEPFPERLLGLLRREDMAKYTVLQNQVQDIPLEIFQALSANDILFIDSSHVVKTGSDVGHILFQILPELKAGVIVHFHDIYWPFEYPREWILRGVAWNEAYFVRSFLLNNDAFEIMYFNSFMAKRHADILRRRMPLGLKVSQQAAEGSGPSSLWLKKVVKSEGDLNVAYR
jgi:Methyltransferase domain